MKKNDFEELLQLLLLILLQLYKVPCPQIHFSEAQLAYLNILDANKVVKQ